MRWISVDVHKHQGIIHRFDPEHPRAGASRKRGQRRVLGPGEAGATRSRVGRLRGFPQTSGQNDLTVVARTVLIILVVPAMPSIDGFAISSLARHAEIDERIRKATPKPSAPTIGMTAVESPVGGNPVIIHASLHNDPAAHRPRSARSADAVRCSRELGSMSTPLGHLTKTLERCAEVIDRDEQMVAVVLGIGSIAGRDQHRLEL